MESLRIIPAQIQKSRLERHAKLKDLLYSQFLEQEGTIYQGGGHKGSMPGSQLNQVSWNLKGSEDPWWASAIIEVRVEYTSNRCKGILSVRLDVMRLQSGKRGSCGRGQFYHTGAAGYLGRMLIACWWGFRGTGRIWSIKLDNTNRKHRDEDSIKYSKTWK